MPSYAIAAGVSGLATLGLLVAERRGSAAGKWATKPIASLAFVAAALARAGGVPASSYGRAILVGLGLSVAGDLLLIGRGRGWFRAGLGAFLAGHVAYAVGFVARGVAPLPTLATAAVVIAVAIAVGRWLLPHVEVRALRIPVLAYITVISAMVTLATGTTVRHGGPLILAGALAFYLSDLAVARDRFVAPGFLNRAWGLPLYYAAQLTLAWTVS